MAVHWAPTRQHGAAAAGRLGPRKSLLESVGDSQGCLLEEGH